MESNYSAQLSSEESYFQLIPYTHTYLPVVHRLLAKTHYVHCKEQHCSHCFPCVFPPHDAVQRHKAPFKTIKNNSLLHLCGGIVVVLAGWLACWLSGCRIFIHPGGAFLLNPTPFVRVWCTGGPPWARARRSESPQERFTTGPQPPRPVGQPYYHLLNIKRAYNIAH